MNQLVIIGLIKFWSGVYEMDASLIESVVRHESSMNSNAIGAAGEIGLMQIKPQYVKGYTREQLFDPQINLIVGIKQLKDAKRTCVHQNDIEWLTCFNMGNTGAKKLAHPDLFPYIKSIRRLMVVRN